MRHIYVCMYIYRVLLFKVIFFTKILNLEPSDLLESYSANYASTSYVFQIQLPNINAAAPADVQVLI